MQESTKILNMAKNAKRKKMTKIKKTLAELLKNQPKSKGADLLIGQKIDSYGLKTAISLQASNTVYECVKTAREANWLLISCDDEKEKSFHRSRIRTLMVRARFHKSSNAMHSSRIGPIKPLCCDRCQRSFKGRQWRRATTGIGICNTCSTIVQREIGNSSEFQRLYGARGIHWGLQSGN